VEPYWPGLFAKALEGIIVKDLITNVGSSVGGGGAAPRGGNWWSLLFSYIMPK
jgi:large subunit ribosomal protein LP1